MQVFTLEEAVDSKMPFYLILLKPPCRPLWQLARICELKQFELIYNCFFACSCTLCVCVFVCVHTCVRVCLGSTSACVWAGKTSAIVGLLHADNWKPVWLKITRSFPNLSSFETAHPGCFDFQRASPWNARGHRRSRPVTRFLLVVPMRYN